MRFRQLPSRDDNLGLPAALAEISERLLLQNHCRGGSIAALVEERFVLAFNSGGIALDGFKKSLDGFRQGIVLGVSKELSEVVDTLSALDGVAGALSIAGSHKT